MPEDGYERSPRKQKVGLDVRIPAATDVVEIQVVTAPLPNAL